MKAIFILVTNFTEIPFLADKTKNTRRDSQNYFLAFFINFSRNMANFMHFTKLFLQLTYQTILTQLYQQGTLNMYSYARFHLEGFNFVAFFCMQI